MPSSCLGAGAIAMNSKDSVHYCEASFSWEHRSYPSEQIMNRITPDVIVALREMQLNWLT